MFRIILILAFLAGASARADLLSAQMACRSRVQAGLVDGLAMAYVDGQGAHPIFCGRITSERESFELGSISKTFAGITLSALVLKNKIDLEAPISKYVPELAGTFAGTVSARLLATHSAQFVRSFPGVGAASWSYNDAQLIAFLKSYQPDLRVLPPGTRQYSNLGFGTLALVISRAAGMPFPQVLQGEILSPLGMMDTGFINTPSKPAALVQGYNLALLPLPFWGVSSLGIGAGGVTSDSHDMLIYLQANLHPDASPLGRAMVLSQTLGLGWDSLPGTLPTWKNGLMTDGFSTLMKFDPSRQEGVIVLADTYNEASVLSIGAIAMGAADTLTESPLSAPFLEAVIGTYKSADGHAEIDVGLVASSHIAVILKDQNGNQVARLMSITGEDARFKVNNGFDSGDELEFVIDPVTQKMQVHYFAWSNKRSDGKEAFRLSGTLEKMPAVLLPAKQ